MIRIFIALDLEKSFLTEIENLRELYYPEDRITKWESKEKMHMTLKFLGDTEEEKIPQIIEVIEDVSLKYNEIDLTFNGFGLFKKDNQPRILYASFNDNNYLTQMVDELNSKLLCIGFAKDNRKFKPHLTLLRIKGKENFDNINKLNILKPDKIEAKLNKIVLYKSELKTGGSVYTKIKYCELK